MKEYYKIGEISKLYNIGTDSLRYYEEIGILRPRRDENGYRMYSVGDIRTLNVLRELRSIGFPMKDIKAHLKDFDVQQTLDMFAEAIERINRRQQELELLKKNVSERIDEINYYLREKNTHESISVQSLPERHILKLSEKALRDDNIDFVLKKLQSKYEEQLYIVGNGEIGALIDSDCLLEGEYGRLRSSILHRSARRGVRRRASRRRLSLHDGQRFLCTDARGVEQAFGLCTEGRGQRLRQRRRTLPYRQPRHK